MRGEKQMHISSTSSTANKASHGDVYYIAVAPQFRSRAC